MEEEIIKRLIEKVENLTKNQGWLFNEHCKKNLQLIIASDCSEDKKIIALTQLYRFAIYERAYLTRDGRVHITTKQDILSKIEKYILQENDNELMNIIEEDIKKLRDHVDNPVKYIKEDIMFDEKYPGAKF